MAAVGAVKQFISDSIQMASQHEDTMAKFNNQLENYAAATHTSSDKIAKMLDIQAQGWADVSRFSKDSVIAGESVLLTYNKIGADVLPQAISATADFAAKMGTDFPQAAAVLGRAIGDPVTGIGRLNAQFKLFEPTQLKAIQYMAAHGAVSKAQIEILTALTDKIGGTAQAMGETFAGKMEILNNKFDEMKIKVGSALIPALSGLLDALSPVIDAALPAITTGITTTIQQFSGLIQIIEAVAQKAGELWTAFTKALAPLGDVAAAAYGAIKPALDKITVAVQGFWSTLFDDGSSGAGEAAGKAKLAISRALKVGDITPDDAQKMQPEKFIPSDFGTRLHQAIAKYGPDIQAGFGELLKAGGDFIMTVGWPMLQSGFNFIGQQILAWLGSRASDFMAGVSPWIQNIANGIENGWTTINGSLFVIQTNIGKFFTDNIQGMVDHGADIISSIVAGMADHVNEITGQLSDAVFGTNGAVQALTNGAGQFVDQGANFIANIIKGISQQAQYVVTELTNDVVGFISDKGLKAAIDGFSAAGKGIIDGIIAGLEANANAVIQRLQQLALDSVKSFLLALHIGSPSKVFAEMGTQIPAGVAEGINQAAKLAIDATVSMANSVAAAGDGSLVQNTNNNQRTTNIYNFGMNIYGQQTTPAANLAQALRKQ